MIKNLPRDLLEKNLITPDQFEKINAQAFIVSQTMGGNQSPTDLADMPGGGSSGGGGSSDSF